MRKLLSTILFIFVALNNSYADLEYQWVRLYYYETYNIEDFFEYNDETFIDLEHTLESIQTDSINGLIPGETCRLRITYNNYNIDSCYAIYDFIPESYEVDGFWTYRNNGLLVAPDYFYGIYNIELDDPIPYDPDEYSDSDREAEFFTWLDINCGPYFVIGTTGLSHIKIEILAYREVEI